jgi:hypothetical protein
MRTREKIFATFMVLTVLITLYAYAFGQVVPPGGGPVVQYNSHGFGYQADAYGNSTALYDYRNGMTGYTSRDRYGNITAGGTIYQAMPRSSVVDPVFAPIERLYAPSRGGSSYESGSSLSLGASPY